MSERSRQIRVGMGFILSIIVLVIGVLWFKDFNFGGANHRVTVEFATTSGLARGDPVEVHGVPSGRVLVVLDLAGHVILYPETRIVIENVGIMGRKLVAVDAKCDRSLAA